LTEEEEDRQVFNKEMSHKLCSMCVLLMLLVFGTYGEVAAQHSMKGYELYSWRTDGGDWSFSLLIGTNRLKTKEEITAPNNRLSSVSALKEKLQQLPKGEEVIWQGMSFPEEAVVKVIQAYCDERGIKLQVITEKK
jgi:hypothetical protein